MPFLYIANWKMNMHFDQALSFATTHHQELTNLSKNDSTIIICPSYVSLAPLATLFKDSAIAIGGQNCASYESGAYTGEVSAQSLAQMGVAYCIVGHQERRTLFGETPDRITQKCMQLINNHIEPIVCVGTGAATSHEGLPYESVIDQLLPILAFIKDTQLAKIIIAYEPAHAIGSGKPADAQSIEQVLGYIKNQFKTLSFCTPTLLYGGSVNETNSAYLKKINNLDGFLIGNASTNFQTFEKIVS